MCLPYRSDKLRELLDSPAYSGELVGWGVDYAYLAVLGPRLQTRFAVLHEFQVRFVLLDLYLLR